MRRVLLSAATATATVLAAIVLIAALVPAAAHGAADGPKLITWTIQSRYVDVAKAQFNGPPPGEPHQPPALRVDVLLPPGYDGVRRFPILFLLHGHGDTYQSYVDPARGDLLDIAKGLSAIVVMPEGAQSWYTNWWDGGARGSDGRAWENYILDEVIPMAQRKLAILPDRADHAIAGVSMGGEGAVYFAEQLPGYFGSVAALSGVLSIQRPEWPIGFDTQGQKYQEVYGDPSAQRFYWTGHNPTALVASLRDTRVFVRVGDGLALPLSYGDTTNVNAGVSEAELSLQAGDFVNAARAAGVDVTFEPTTGIHDWPWWRAGLAAALQWGFFQQPPAAPGWSYTTVAQAGQAWDLRYSFTAPPGTVETFARHGDTLTATGGGVVHISRAGHPSFTATLPFTRTLP